MLPQALVYLALASLAIGFVALVIGLRGKRVDREPRCPSRRCKYALGSVIESRRASNDEPFPLTCPECGRSVAHERALRIGTRKKRKRTAAIGTLLAAIGAGLLGLAAYATWNQAKAVSTMPLWLLLYFSERDTDANKFVHQRELADRAMAGKIDPEDAAHVVDRILRWQADPSVQYAWAGAALAHLAVQGAMTESQQQRAWANLWMFALRAPESAEPGQPLPLSIVAEERGGRGAGNPVIWKNPWQRPSGVGMQPEAPAFQVTALRIDGIAVDLHEQHRRLGSLDHSPTMWPKSLLGWAPSSGPWDILRVPDGNVGDTITIELDLSWDVTDSGNAGLHPDPEQSGKWVTAGQWLAHRGVPTKGTRSVRATTRIAPAGSIAPQLVRRAEVDEWLRSRLEKTVIKLVRQPDGELLVYISENAPRSNAGSPSDAPAVFGEAIIHHNGWSRRVGALADHAISGRIGSGSFGGDLRNEMMGLYIMANPTGWELELVPFPERTLLTAERPPAWAGDPIRVPIGVEFDLRCRNHQYYEPFVVPPTAESTSQPVPAP